MQINICLATNKEYIKPLACTTAFPIIRENIRYLFKKGEKYEQGNYTYGIFRCICLCFL